MSPILDLQKRLSEAGRIRIGKTVPGNQGKKGRPVKLDSFRFTTQSQDAAKILAALYGGEAKPWADAPTGKQFEVITEADAVRVMVPPQAMAFTQWLELWKAGGCERRCDGQELATGAPCLCDPEARECKPHTRLSLMLTEMPSSGLWRLDTSGHYAAAELAGGFELARLIAGSTGRSVLGATLRLEQREKKRPGETVKRFAVPVLDFDIDPGALVGETGGPRLQAVTPVPLLPAPSLADQLHAVDDPKQKPQRKNAAPEVKPTGLKPRGRLVEADQTWTVKGSKGDDYTVTRRGGDMSCTCAGWSFRKDCRHITELQSPTDATLPDPVHAVQSEPEGGAVEDTALPAINPTEFAQLWEAITDRAAKRAVVETWGWNGGSVSAWMAAAPEDSQQGVIDDLLALRAGS